MLQNIKADVVYYKTNTDFEMEFNLCGCCRMRLLNSKADDRKTFIADLTRAVSRSNVILIVGNLFGEDNIISNVAGAIGKTLSPADNKAYGIKSDEEINIISGSTPLVSEDGYFGGCIIESGPQTMILLTESRSIKKSILNSLIHPYLEELYAGELKPNAEEEIVEEEIVEEEIVEELAEEVVEEPVLETTENIEEAVEEVDLAEEEVIEETPMLEEPELIIDVFDENNSDENSEDFYSGMIFEEEEEIEMNLPEAEIELFVEPEENEDLDLSEAMKVDNIFLVEEEDDPYFIPTKPPIINLPMLVLMVIILILIGVLCYSLIYIPLRNGIPALDYINNIKNTLFV